jgi:hypothetical protein
MFVTVVLVVLAVIAALNAVVSIAVVRSAKYTQGQKALQVLLIWILPAAGAMLAWHLMHEDETNTEKENPHPAMSGFEDADLHLGRSRRNKENDLLEPEHASGDGADGD